MTGWISRWVKYQSIHNGSVRVRWIFKHELDTTNVGIFRLIKYSEKEKGCQFDIPFFIQINKYLYSFTIILSFLLS